MAHEATIRGIGIGVDAAGEGKGAPAVLLQARGALIPIIVGPEQARAIERAQQGVSVPRPMTHDLLVDIVDDLDGTLERVRIDNIEGETYYAKLDLTITRGGDRTQIVRDARPSDGIALAVRVDCPITVADAVIDEAGQAPDHLGLGTPDFGTGGQGGRGRDIGRGSDPTAVGASEEPDPFDLDEAVDIEIDESEDADDDET